MADTGKSKTSIPEGKKAKEGGGSKKRRKHKKSHEVAGDGAPSLSPTSAPLSQNQASAGQIQKSSGGATANIKGMKENKDGELLTKGAVKHENKETKASETVGKLSLNHADKETRVSEGPGKTIQNHESIDIRNNELTEKGTSKEESKVRESPVQKAVQQDSKETTVGEQSRKSTPKLIAKDRTDKETLVADKQIQLGNEIKGDETPAQDGAQQKGKVHEKCEHSQKNKAKGGRIPDSADTQQKSKVAANAEVGKKRLDVGDGGGLKQQTKVEPGKGMEVVDGEQKSKAQLRAERRAVQEAQRAAKDAKKNDTVGGLSTEAASSASAAPVKKEHPSDKSKTTSDRPKPASDKPKPAGERTGIEKGFKKKPAVNAVVHAETEEQMWARKENEILGKSLKIDNSIMNLGFQYFYHNIVGANARCMALLATLKEVITKYRTPDEKELSRDLEKNFLNPCITYINYCRPISTSMGNAIKYLKHQISNIPSDMDDETAISKLQDEIDSFIQVNILKAAEAVALYAMNKIVDGDVVLVYAASSLIGQVLKTAYKGGKKFRVIVVEGRPRSEGKSMLRYLVRCGIACSYIYIGSASHAMSEATKVFLGAAAMFAIGDMYSRSGNSMIAALAKANNIPVLVCCETYKFTDKVQLHTDDSNLHTRGKDLVSIGHRPPILANWEEIGLGLLNLMYDVTGSEYVTAVVTELGMLPCTSVPVVLRRQEDTAS